MNATEPALSLPGRNFPAVRRALRPGVVALIGLLAAVAGAQEVEFGRDVAPILRVYCVGCHNDEDLEGELSVETYAKLRRGGEGGDPVIPGDAETSFLVRSIEGRERPHMPPRRATQLPEAARATLRRWVEQGARGPEIDRSILRSLVAPRIEGAADRRVPVTALAMAPRGDVLAVGRFGRVELRDPVTYALRETIDDLPGKVHGVELSDDGRQLVVATGIAGLAGEARVIALDGSSAPRVFGGHDDVLYDATLSPDESMLATAGYDRIIRLWKVAGGELLREIDVHKGAVFDLQFDPSGRVLASASADETVKLWRVADGVRLDTLNQPQGEQLAVTFTPDGEYILSTGADRRIHLWRFVSRETPRLNPPLASRFAHESAVVALRLVDGGRRVISAAQDGTMKIWSVPDLQELAAYEAQSDVVSSVAASPEGEAFVVGRLDGSLERYGLADARSQADTEPAMRRLVAPRSESQGELRTRRESEPNDSADRAEPIELPARIKGAIARPGDRDLFRFTARAGEELTLEVDAARSKSPLDSRIEILDSAGQPVEQVTLQAVRDSWFTFRGKDSDTSDDFRVHNWREMELDQYLFASGEVVRLWLYPRGPDSGFKVYPGFGKRHTFFSTTALSHPLGEPCYIVTAHPAGSQPPPNGLPVFRLYWENDDDPTRRRGRDSLLLFTAPRDGEYLARISDTRGFGGEDYSYALTIRDRRPDFAIAIGGKSPAVSPGSGRELRFAATRKEGFDAAIRIDIDSLPDGFTATTPVTIEAGQAVALGAIYADPDAASPDEAMWKDVRVTATATIRGETVVRDLGDLGEIRLGAPAKLTVEILPAGDTLTAAGDAPAGEPSEVVRRGEDGLLEFTIRPGETIRARVRTTRHAFDGRIELGKEDSGRNLPHGLYVDNIGLNGLLIVEGQTERDFFITAAPIATPGTRLFHLRATADGGQCSAPARIRVLPGKSDADEPPAATRRSF